MVVEDWPDSQQFGQKFDFKWRRFIVDCGNLWLNFGSEITKEKKKRVVGNWFWIFGQRECWKIFKLNGVL